LFLVLLFISLNFAQISSNIIFDNHSLEVFVKKEVKSRKGPKAHNSSPISSIQPPQAFKLSNLLESIVIRAVIESPKVGLDLSPLFDHVYRHEKYTGYHFSHHTSRQVTYKGMIFEELFLEGGFLNKLVGSEIKASCGD
jgi:hypothetical protein